MVSTKKWLIPALALMLALCLTACGGSTPPAQPTAAPQPAAQQPAQQQGGNDTDYVIEYDLDVIYDNIEEAYYGIMETGEIIGFGSNADGSFALVLFTDGTQHVSFVGPATVSENIVSITDDVNGMQLGFEVLYGDDDGVVIDLGDLGGGVLVPCTPEELIDILIEAVTTTEAIG